MIEKCLLYIVKNMVIKKAVLLGMGNNVAVINMRHDKCMYYHGPYLTLIVIVKPMMTSH